MAMVYDGLVKLAEECGELTQIIAKKLAYWSSDEHPDGQGSMEIRLQEEMADVYAALDFVVGKRKLDVESMAARHQDKLAIFRQWDFEN